MPTLTVLFPSAAGASFDYDYLANVHLPLVLNRWRDSGLEAVDLLRGIGVSEGSEPPFLAIGMLRFNSLDRLRAAMTGEYAAEIGADIRKFTNVEPIMQVNVAIAK